MFERLADNLSLLMLQRKLTSKQLSLSTDIPLSTINKLRSGDASNPTMGSLIPIAKYFGISLNQLIGLSPSMSSSLEHQLVYRLPLLSWGQATAFNKREIGIFKQTVASDLAVQDGDFALITQQEYPGVISKGAILICSGTLKPVSGDIVVVGKAGVGEAVLKKLIIDVDTQLLCPLEPELSTLELKDPLKIFGVVIQIKINLKSLGLIED